MKTPDKTDKTKEELSLEIKRLSKKVVALEAELTGLRAGGLEITAMRLNESQRLAKLGNWDWDILGNRLYWSDEIYRIFGLKPQEFGATYEAFLNSVHPDDREFVKKSVNEALVDKKPYDIDHRIVLPGGEERIVHERAEVTLGADGSPARMAGTVQDITERKHIEKELTKRASLLKEAMHIARMGSWEVDLVTNKVSWSDEVYDLFGVDKESFEVTYENFMGLLHPDDRHLIKKSVDAAVKTKKPSDIEYRALLPGGEERIIRERAEATFDQCGRPVRMAGTVQDVTERKKIEDELLKAKKLESIGELAGGIAHDFNNQLMGILGNVSIAKSGLREDERLFWILSQIEKAALRTKDLTKQLLTFSRGGGPVRETANVEQIIKDSAALTLKGTDVECTFHVKNGVKQVDMDVGQIAQVFNNVILNARHAMGGKGRMDITTENVTLDDADSGGLPEGDYVKITVEDTGPGIPKDVLPKIFDPFFTTKEKASGLGLAISYSIVKKHGGSISAASKDGMGAAFFICLPASAPVSANHGVKEDTPSFVKGGVLKGKVLVMDDEEVVRDVSGEMLNLMGYNAEFAADGKTAVDMFRLAKESGEPFAAVIMDLTVPGGMGGKEAMEKLLEIDPQVKAVVSSGYSKDPIMCDFTKYGFSAVIAKPYRVAEFSKVVKGVMEGKG